MCVTTWTSSRQPSAARYRTSISWLPRPSVSAGKDAAPAVEVDRRADRAPSTHSSTSPGRRRGLSEPFTVVETVSGASNSDGDCGETATVVVVRSAAPSSYSASMSAVLKRSLVETDLVHQTVERVVREAVAPDPVVGGRADAGHGDREVVLRRDRRAVQVQRSRGALSRERDVVPLIGDHVPGRGGVDALLTGPACPWP